MAALVIPAQVAMLPLFLLMKQLGLVNSFGGVIVPALASVFGIFLVRQYARSIPDELLEAARIDGAGSCASSSRSCCRCSPVLVTLAIFTFMGAWNDFMWPLIVLTDQEHYTLPVALATLSREHIMDVEMMMAGAVVTVVPVLALFLVLQRYYIQGLLLGSVRDEASDRRWTGPAVDLPAIAAPPALPAPKVLDDFDDVAAGSWCCPTRSAVRCARSVALAAAARCARL